MFENKLGKARAGCAGRVRFSDLVTDRGRCCASPADGYRAGLRSRHGSGSVPHHELGLGRDLGLSKLSVQGSGYLREQTSCRPSC